MDWRASVTMILHVMTMINKSPQQGYIWPDDQQTIPFRSTFCNSVPRKKKVSMKLKIKF